ncbi:unnamed protein product [Durusdinium trenchii]|uniref:Uncharacterized protein n=1 Tax=Durusdinium trenchii TaxID=1381693 RepID=A0ABP0R0E2_9DINO
MVRKALFVLTWACLPSSLAQYVRGTAGSGSGGCPIGAQQVPVERCQAAAQALSILWIGQITSNDVIPGCQGDGFTGYFNTNQFSSGSSVNINPICEVVGTQTSTSSSSTTTQTSTTWTQTHATLTVTRELRFPDVGGTWSWLQDGTLQRLHTTPRRHLFVPSDVADCPVQINSLLSHRTTFVDYVQGGSQTVTDSWHDPSVAHLMMPFTWTGRSIFYLSGQTNSVAQQNQTEFSQDGAISNVIMTAGIGIWTPLLAFAW